VNGKKNLCVENSQISKIQSKSFLQSLVSQNNLYAARSANTKQLNKLPEAIRKANFVEDFFQFSENCRDPAVIEAEYIRRQRKQRDTL
jgi:hypothetical protein